MHSADGGRPVSSIGALIRTADAGDESAATALFAALYDELHGLAERQLRRGGGELTLGTTTLLHEAYLSFADRESASFPDRARFLAYASRAMRGLVVDYARRRQAKKRGGEFHITAVDEVPTPLADEATPETLDRLAAALDTLGEMSPALAELVDLHFFSGFSLVEIARLRGVSERTVQRDWRKARLLLHRLVRPDQPEEPSLA
jgi:RNA polymerase sigma factor (TIGR02999 family)